VIQRARAPLRVDLAGGWTDVAPYAGKRGGTVVNVALSLHAHVLVRRGGTGVRLRALDLGAVVSAGRIADLRADGELALVKAAARLHAPEGPMEIVTRSDAPPGSGLGGSGALGVALIAALEAMRDMRRHPAEVAGLAFETETREAGIIGGKQDQYAAALGGLQFLAFGDPEVAATRLSVPAGALRELEQSLVLCYTGASRVSGDTHRRVWEAFARGERATVAALDGLREAAFAMRTALERGALGDVARLLDENWACQQALAEGIRTPTMAALETVGREAGADGVKACGAGAGGCLAFLARPGREADVAEALRAAGGVILHAGFDMMGVATWEAAER
jgi:D-glycero-alpha-D-manno-heptose-7-phosphate kinase